MSGRPRLLTIAGSDSGGGAGIQADLKTFAAHGAYGLSVITALTAQNTREVRLVEAASPGVVAAQIDAVLDDIGADAVKIGMLGSGELVRTVAGRLRAHLGGTATPIVLDPVMVAKSGAVLLADEAVEALTGELWPLAAVVTPNLPELARLTARPVGTPGEIAAAARSLAERGPAVLAKGGHASGDEVLDLLVTSRGERRFVHPRLATTATHGTGCTLSSAIAARMGRGEALEEAVEGAIEYLAGAIAAAAAAPPLGRPGGHGPVDPLYRMP